VGWPERITGTGITLYGGGLLLHHLQFLATGWNALAPHITGMGMLLAGLTGAFALPIGVGLLIAPQRSVTRLGVGALALNAIVRLSVLAIPEVREAIGVPLVLFDFALFGIPAVGLGVFGDDT
jgi:hypothetical protein